jgi:hypothetical protein
MAGEHNVDLPSTRLVVRTLTLVARVPVQRNVYRSCWCQFASLSLATADSQPGNICCPNCRQRGICQVSALFLGAINNRVTWMHLNVVSGLLPVARDQRMLVPVGALRCMLLATACLGHIQQRPGSDLPQLQAGVFITVACSTRPSCRTSLQGDVAPSLNALYYR